MEIKKANPTDGKMNTKDIIYKINASFEKLLEKNIEKVKMKNKSNKYELSKNKSNERVYLKTSNKKNKKKKGTGIRKIIQSSKTKDKEIEIFKVEDYSLVERIIFLEYEIIKFDFRKNKELKNKSKCDINFSIIDGMGVEYDDEFEIEDNYEKVFDMSNNNIYLHTYDDKFYSNSYIIQKTLISEECGLGIPDKEKKIKIVKILFILTSSNSYNFSQFHIYYYQM